jgi:hypothetical protein
MLGAIEFRFSPFDRIVGSEPNMSAKETVAKPGGSQRGLSPLLKIFEKYSFSMKYKIEHFLLFLFVN